MAPGVCAVLNVNESSAYADGTAGLGVRPVIKMRGEGVVNLAPTKMRGTKRARICISKSVFCCNGAGSGLACRQGRETELFELWSLQPATPAPRSGHG